MKRSKTSSVKLSSLTAIFILILALFGTQSCSTGQKISDGEEKNERSWTQTPEVFRGDEVQEYKQILNLFAKAQYPQAQQLLVRFYRRFPRSLKMAEVQNLHGLIDMKSKKFSDATVRFKKALSLKSDARFRQYMLYNLATAFYESSQFAECETTLRQVDVTLLADDSKYKFFYLQALIAYRKSEFFSAAKGILDASPLLTLSSAPQNRHLMQLHLEKSLEKTPGVEPVEKLLQSYPETPLTDVLLFIGAKRQLDFGERGRAGLYYTQILEKFPNSPFAQESSERLKKMQTLSIADPYTVGVLVPTTGKFSKIGEQCLQGIKLGFQLVGKTTTPSPVTLIVEDSGETPEQAVEALEKLYYSGRASVVIGPLTGLGLEKVVERANELGIPLLSLSQKSFLKPDEKPRYALPFGITDRQQAFAIARYAMDTKQMKRFAILYPNDDFGRAYMTHFWDAIDSLGGDIAAVESYPPDETDFRTIVDKVAGLFYTEARVDESRSMEAARIRDKITKKTSRTEHYYRLPPIVDFDAVFIPDTSKAIGQIVPMFAYRDVDEVSFLGTSTWNSASLIPRTKGYSDRTFFVDGYFAGSSSKRAQDFINNYQAAFLGVEPTTLSAIGYDAAQVVDHIIHQLSAARASIGRDQIRASLINLPPFQGVTGTVGSQDGIFERKLTILGIRGARISDAI